MAAYAGIGSRALPGDIGQLMRRYGACAALNGDSLRSGAADGADSAFEHGATVGLTLANTHQSLQPRQDSTAIRAYLPWKGYNDRVVGQQAVVLNHPDSNTWVSRCHPAAGNLSRGVNALMRRNTHQILGDALDDPSAWVVCWTPDGATNEAECTSKTGGTGFAIRVASKSGIPVFNLAREDHRARISAWCDAQVDQYKAQGVDVDQALEAAANKQSHLGGDVIHGDLIEAFSQGQFDAIVHGCNTQHTMGAGIAALIARAYPDALQADMQTRKGDQKKLGTYTTARVGVKGREADIINLYSQHRYGRVSAGTPPLADYPAIERGFKAINAAYAGKTIGVPRIGAGLAGGDWPTIAGIIRRVTPDVNVVLVEYEAGPEPEVAKAPEQQGLAL